MANENIWSESQRQASVDALWNGRCPEPCPVKHWRDDNNTGTVSTAKGIDEEIWEVVTESGAVEKFRDVEELVAFGWVVA